MPTITATSGSKWTDETLQFFRVKLQTKHNFQDFFGVDTGDISFNDATQEFLQLDLPKVLFQEVIDLSGIKFKIVRMLVLDIIAVLRTNQAQEAAVDNMARMMFFLFDYDDIGLTIRSQEVLNLEMSNKVTKATPDICIEQLNGSKILVVQEDKSYLYGLQSSSAIVIPQLVAEMIAAFQTNLRRLQDLGRIDEINEQQMLGIVMIGSSPTFYRMNVTPQLSDCIKFGHRPEFETVIWQYVIPNRPSTSVNAILYKASALHIAECYEALKHLISKPTI